MSRERFDLISRAIDGLAAGDLGRARRLALEASELEFCWSEKWPREIALAEVLHRAGENECAERVLKRALAAARAAAADQFAIDCLWYARGEHLVGAEKFEDAIDALSRVSQSSVNYPHAKALVGIAKRQLGHADALKTIADALALADDDQRPRVQAILERFTSAT